MATSGTRRRVLALRLRAFPPGRGAPPDASVPHPNDPPWRRGHECRSSRRYARTRTDNRPKQDHPLASMRRLSEECPMTVLYEDHQLSAEQRRALELLADAGEAGCTGATFLAHGFKVDILGELAGGGRAVVYRRPTHPG